MHFEGLISTQRFIVLFCFVSLKRRGLRVADKCSARLNKSGKAVSHKAETNSLNPRRRHFIHCWLKKTRKTITILKCKTKCFQVFRHTLSSLCKTFGQLNIRKKRRLPGRLEETNTRLAFCLSRDSKIHHLFCKKSVWCKVVWTEWKHDVASVATRQRDPVLKPIDVGIPDAGRE